MVDEFTVFVLREVLDIAREGNIAKVVRGPQHGAAQNLLAKWMSLQVTTGEVLQAACERGEVNDEQLDFALQWLSNLDTYDHDEATAHLDVWLEWVASK